jgi:predicted porin
MPRTAVAWPESRSDFQYTWDGDPLKKALAFLPLSLLISQTPAYAQSSVTLYGLIDAGFVYINNQNGHSNLETVTGQTNGSRFGVRGEEDLGGGLSAIFTLENGFDPSNGKELQNSRLFGRQSFVGLSSKSYGTVTLGRQYEAIGEWAGEIAATSLWGWLGTHPGDFDNLMSTIRTNNSIKYVSPSFSGLQVTSIFAPGGVAGDFESGRIYTAAVRYMQGPLTAMLAYDNVNNPSVAGYDGTLSPGQAGYTSPVKNPIYSGYASADVLQIFAAAASYQIGAGKLGLVYTNTRFHDMLRTASTPNSGNATFNSFEINGRYYVSPLLQLATAFDYTDAGTARYTQTDAGIDYFLSKRTDLMLAGFWQHATGTDSTGEAAVANIGSLTRSSTPNQIAIKASLRTRF